MPVYKSALLDLADEIQNLLRPADGKGRNDQIAAAIKRLLDPQSQLAHVIRTLFTVQPISVGGFDDEIIRLLHRTRIAENGLVGIAHVAGEGDLPRLPCLGQPDLDRR